MIFEKYLLEICLYIVNLIHLKVIQKLIKINLVIILPATLYKSNLKSLKARTNNKHIKKFSHFEFSKILVLKVTYNKIGLLK
jgi:hypothetical protein